MGFRKFFSEWKYYIVGFLFIVLVGFLFRFINLTKLPIFVDEAIYVRWSQIMANEPTLRFLPLSDGKQPLFMWVLMFAIKLFNNPLFVGRLISVFTGIGTLIGIFVLSYLLFKNKKISLFSSFLYAISPFSVFFDRMALVDSMLSMLGIWTAVFSYLTVKYKRLDCALIAGILLGFASLTKSSALFIAIIIPFFWIINDWSKVKSKIFIDTLRLGFLTGVIYLLTFIMYNIQRLGPNFGLLSSRTKDYVLPISHLWTRFFDPLIPYLKDYAIWLLSLGPWPIIIILILGYFVSSKRYIKEIIVLSLLSFGPVIIQAELAKVFTARYVFFTIPYLFILAGVSINGLSNKLVKYLLIVSCVLFVFLSIKFDYYLWTSPEKANLSRGERSGYLEEWTAGHGIFEISNYLKNEALKLKEGEKIVVGTEGYFGTLPDGLQLYVNQNPKIIVIGVGVIIEDVPESLVESLKAGNKTYLVVNKSRFKGNPEKQNLKLIASYPKALRLTDSKQYFQHGPFEELYFFELIK